MHKTQAEILSIFRNSGRNLEMSTSSILANLDARYSSLKECSLSPDKERARDSRREIAKLHRKILHHVNKLVKFKILRQTRHGEKGEKFYSLALEDGEEILGTFPQIRKIKTIEKPELVSLPIEKYEQKGIILKYEPETFIDRLNSVVIFANKLKTSIYNLLEKTFSIVNDSICIENFQDIINEDTKALLEKANDSAESYNKLINLVIDISKVKNIKDMTRLLEDSDRLNNIKFIFVVSSSDMQERAEALTKVVEIFSRKRKILNMRNSSLSKTPCFIGSAGPYNFIERELKEASCLACSQSSIMIDMDKFYSVYSSDVEKFKDLMLAISKSLLSANSVHRKRSYDYLKPLVGLNPEDYDILRFSRNYIRFWNFGAGHEEDMDYVLNMISEAKKQAEEFARMEEKIYKSCGMTTRFQIALSCAFPDSSDNLSAKKYAHLEIKNSDDLYKKEIKKKIAEREELSGLFSGGNDVTFFPSGQPETDEIVREIQIILNSYKIPFFSFNFSKLKGDMTLSVFIK